MRKSIGNSIEKGKYFGLRHISTDSIWSETDNSPDYNLAEIHASTVGFQAQYNDDIGSLLFYEFSKRIKKNVMSGKKEELGRTFEKIENNLLERGNPQHIKPTFLNNTRYLKLFVHR